MFKKKNSLFEKVGDLSLVFLVSGASYEAYFVSVANNYTDYWEEALYELQWLER